MVVSISELHEGSYGEWIRVKPNELQHTLLDEIFKALGFGRHHPARFVLEPLFSSAAHRFARIAVTFDQDVATHGFREAARCLLPRFTREVHVRGAEYIPTEGPLLVVSNHPGTINGLAIASSLPRPDLKIVASGVPFISNGVGLLPILLGVLEK
ncbi:MAG: hypothetical protein L6461_04105 [Anaerolineae bacterium]|nr:hypothetical protein [Anaerolineae bacterium]